ncbi:MAG: mandelate racemase/muconate lactonizing enzyme family protein [Acidimicrobiales bacterium]
MKISEIETFVVGNPPPGFGGRYFLFVKLTTNDGVTGLGEVYAATFRPDVMVAAVEDLADHFLMGEDPFHIERFWRRAYSRGFTQRPDTTLQGAMSGLEIACWDIIGKACDKPVYELLGGRVHEALRAYTYIYPEPDDQSDVYVDPDLAAARALQYVDAGFTAVKFDSAGPYTAMGGHQPSLERIELSVQFLSTIREAVGTRADLLFGTHGQFTSSGAIRLAQRLEPFDPLWFEEPVPPDNVPEMAKVANQTSVPIATGERLTTKAEFARVLEAKAASILQLNLGRSGGILEGKKIAGMAEAFGAQIAPHCYCGPVVGMANAHLSATSPNFLILECIRDWQGFHADILEKPLRMEDGYMVLPTDAGLGVTLNEDVARAHPYEGNQTHLVAADDPIYVADTELRAQ